MARETVSTTITRSWIIGGSVVALAIVGGMLFLSGRVK